MRKMLHIALEALRARWDGGGGPARRPERPAVVSSGLPALDRALGIGGLPRGRLVELAGPPASGKTSLALQLVVQAQRGGGAATILDIDRGLVPSYARALGASPRTTLIARPEGGERALELARCLVGSGAVDLVVLDSLEALVPEEDLSIPLSAEGSARPGLVRRGLISLARCARRTGTLVVVIDGLRPAAGATQELYAAVRLGLSVEGEIRRGGRVVGSRVGLRVVRSCWEPRGHGAAADLYFGRGFSGTSRDL